MVLIGSPIKKPGAKHLSNEEQIIKSIIDTRLKSIDLDRKYSWTMRTEVLRQAQVLNILIEKAQYDENGQVVYKTT